MLKNYLNGVYVVIAKFRVVFMFLIQGQLKWRSATLWSRLGHGIDSNIATFFVSCSFESYIFLRG